MPDLISVAKAALLEITPEATIGAPSGQVDEAGATTVTFQANMSGYPGWHWTVSIATLDDAEPSVLEVELMPGNGALLAPDWVPWSERLADYEAAQEALAASEEPEDSELESDDDDDDDDLGSDVLHGGDLDGVDIDEPEDDSDDDSDEDDSDDDDSDEADSDDDDSDDDDSDDDDDPDEESDVDDDDSDDEDDDLGEDDSDDDGDDRTY